MAAVREASLKLRMDSGAFAADLRATTEKVKAAASSMGGALKRSLGTGFGAGLKSAGKSLGGMASSMKGMLGQAVTLGGAFSFGAFAHQAMEAEEAAGKIAQRLRALGENGTTAAGVLGFIRERSVALNATTTDLSAAYDALLAATGDNDFSSDSLDSVVTLQDSLRISAQSAAGIVSMLNEKIGATGDSIREDFGPALYDAFNQGGIQAEEFVQIGPKLLSMLPALGLKGGEGMTKLIGMLNATDDAGGDVTERVGQIRAMLLKFNDPAMLKPLTKQVRGLKFTEAEDSVARLKKTIATKGGFEALQKLLGAKGKTAVIFGALMKPFDEAMEKAKALGLGAEESKKLAIDALNAELERVTKVTSTAATLEEEKRKRQDESSKKMQVAIDRMAATFTQPKMLGAIEKLAARLPALADGFAKLMDVVIEHPVLAAGGYVGAQVLGAGLLGASGSMAGGAAKSLGTQVAAAMATMRAGAVPAGVAMGTAGGAALVAGAGAIGAALGYAIYKGFAEPAMQKEHEATTKGTAEVSMEAESASYSKDVERQKRALKLVQQQRVKVSESENAWTDVFGGAASMLTGAKSPSEQRAEAKAELDKQEAKLREKIAKNEQAHQRVARAAEVGAAALERLGRAATSARGVAPPPATIPGATPAGG